MQDENYSIFIAAYSYNIVQYIYSMQFVVVVQFSYLQLPLCIVMKCSAIMCLTLCISTLSQGQCLSAMWLHNGICQMYRRYTKTYSGIFRAYFKVTLQIANTTQKKSICCYLESVGLPKKAKRQPKLYPVLHSREDSSGAHRGSSLALPIPQAAGSIRRP